MPSSEQTPTKHTINPLYSTNKRHDAPQNSTKNPQTNHSPADRSKIYARQIPQSLGHSSKYLRLTARITKSPH